MPSWREISARDIPTYRTNSARGVPKQGCLWAQCPCRSLSELALEASACSISLSIALRQESRVGLGVRKILGTACVLCVWWASLAF